MCVCVCMFLYMCMGNGVYVCICFLHPVVHIETSWRGDRVIWWCESLITVTAWRPPPPLLAPHTGRGLWLAVMEPGWCSTGAGWQRLISGPGGPGSTWGGGGSRPSTDKYRYSIPLASCPRTNNSFLVYRASTRGVPQPHNHRGTSPHQSQCWFNPGPTSQTVALQ